MRTAICRTCQREFPDIRSGNSPRLYCSRECFAVPRRGRAFYAHVTRPAAERFWEKVDKSGECWIWTSGHNPQGYGLFQGHPAHRFAYELLVGAIPVGLVMDHLCRNPPCVNPAHLEPVTNAENIRRGFALKPGLRRICDHDWTNPENVYVRADGSRRCRACRLAQLAPDRTRRTKVRRTSGQ